MSCIAVNIHEVKEKLIRLELVEEIDGKNGAKQQGKYRDMDTGELVTGYKLSEPGFYEYKTVWKGVNIQDVRKTGGKSTGTRILLSQEVIQDTNKLFYAQDVHLVVGTYTGSIRPFDNLQPTTRMEYWHLSIRRLPG